MLLRWLFLCVNLTAPIMFGQICPEIWPKIILGVSVSVFLNEIYIWLVDWVKQIAITNLSVSYPLH